MNASHIFKFFYFKDFQQCLTELSKIASHEDWDYKTNPSGKLPILYNYIYHTFLKIQSENKVEHSGDYVAFNTGLVTNNQEEIFAFGQKNRHPTSPIENYFYGWRKASDRDMLNFTKLPEVANYFHNPADLIYDLKIELRTNIDHIIQDNKERFPDSLKSMENHLLSSILSGTIEDAKRRIKRNYKTAIPQFYKGKLQLLLPLCLIEKAKADLALVVEKENGIYRASTCLTLDMAINNARLIAKPDDEWLKP